MQSLDRVAFKRLVNSMSKEFRDSNGGGIVERFEAVSKLLFVKMVDERISLGLWPDTPAAEPEMAWRRGDVARTVYERVRKLWLKATGGSNAAVLQGNRAAFPNDVNAVAKIVHLLQPYRLDSVDVDVKGVAYEELLKDTFEKNDNQQYFTPRHLMDFMVSLADPGPNSVVCDPAAGSGGFLVGALEYVSREHGSTKKPIVRGVDVDERMSWVARINIFLHGGDPANVTHLPGAGALQPLTQIENELPRGGFSTILTNPPFGSDMTDQVALQAFKTGKGRSTRRRGVLFIERCLDLLQPDGILAIVIDDSILNLAGNADIRQIIREKAIVQGVISLPDVAFMPYSTAKSSVLVLAKRSSVEQIQGPTFMADAEHVGNRPNGDPLYQDVPTVDDARPLLSDLPEIEAAWKRFQTTGQLESDTPSSKVFLTDINAYIGEGGGDRLDVNYFHPARAVAADVLNNATFPTYELQELFDVDNTTVKPSQEQGDSTISWLGLGDITSGTGEYRIAEIPGDRIKSSAHSFRGGDILISKLRPKLRKVVLLPEDQPSGYCSAELVVLRGKEEPAANVIAAYVAYLLRSDLGFGQQVYQITGVGRPRVGIPALRKLRIPVPPISYQLKVLSRLEDAFERYQTLYEEAERLRTEGQEVLWDAYASSVESVTSPDVSRESAASSSSNISMGSSSLASA